MSWARNSNPDMTINSACDVLQVVAAAGAVRHEDLVSLTEKSFQSLSIDPTTAKQLTEEDPACFTGSEVSTLA